MQETTYSMVTPYKSVPICGSNLNSAVAVAVPVPLRVLIPEVSDMHWKAQTIRITARVPGLERQHRQHRREE